jgi:hypothetical protein
MKLQLLQPVTMEERVKEDSSNPLTELLQINLSCIWKNLLSSDIMPKIMKLELKSQENSSQ